MLNYSLIEEFLNRVSILKNANRFQDAQGVKCIKYIATELRTKPGLNPRQWPIQDFTGGRGALTPKVAAATYYLATLALQLHENERNWTEIGRGRIPSTPLDPPLQGFFRLKIDIKKLTRPVLRSLTLALVAPPSWVVEAVGRGRYRLPRIRTCCSATHCR